MNINVSVLDVKSYLVSIYSRKPKILMMLGESSTSTVYLETRSTKKNVKLALMSVLMEDFYELLVFYHTRSVSTLRKKVI